MDWKTGDFGSAFAMEGPVEWICDKDELSGKLGHLSHVEMPVVWGPARIFLGALETVEAP
jgi:hypothetical protein